MTSAAARQEHAPLRENHPPQNAAARVAELDALLDEADAQFMRLRKQIGQARFNGDWSLYDDAAAQHGENLRRWAGLRAERDGLKQMIAREMGAATHD